MLINVILMLIIGKKNTLQNRWTHLSSSYVFQPHSHIPTQEKRGLAVQSGQRNECSLIGNQKQWSWKATVKEQSNLKHSSLNLDHDKKGPLFLVSPFNLFTRVELEQLFFFFFFFTAPHNGTEWLLLAMIQLAADDKASMKWTDGWKKIESGAGFTDTVRAQSLIYAEINNTYFSSLAVNIWRGQVSLLRI